MRNHPPPFDAREAESLLGQEYMRLLHDEEADAKLVGARHAALKGVLAHLDAVRKFIAAHAPDDIPTQALGAARAAIAQETPPDDEPGDAC